MKINSRAIITAIPLIAVNLTAAFGQIGFLRTHLSWPLPGDFLFAFALESIAVFLAYMSHATMLANDQSFKLRMASYGMGITVGIMNYSHYAYQMQPAFAAVALGLMSSSSPFLWAVYSRRESRDQLLDKGLIEGRSLKLGSARFFFHPFMSLRVLSHAVWEGETNIASAIVRYSPVADSETARQMRAKEAVQKAQTQAEAITIALDYLPPSATAAQVSDWLRSHGIQVTPAYVRVVRSNGRAAAIDADQATELTADEMGVLHALEPEG